MKDVIISSLNELGVFFKGENKELEEEIDNYLKINSENTDFGELLKKTLIKVLSGEKIDIEEAKAFANFKDYKSLHKFIESILKNSTTDYGIEIKSSDIIKNIYNKLLLSVDTEESIKLNKSEYITIDDKIFYTKGEQIANWGLIIFNKKSKKQNIKTDNSEKIKGGKLLFNKDNGLEDGVDEIFGEEEFDGKKYLHFKNNGKENYIDSEGNLFFEDGVDEIFGEEEFDGKKYLYFDNDLEENYIDSEGNVLFKDGVYEIFQEKEFNGKKYLYFENELKENYIDSEGNLFFKDGVDKIHGEVEFNGIKYLHFSDNGKENYIDSEGDLFFEDGVDEIFGEEEFDGKACLHFKNNGKENYIDSKRNLFFNKNNLFKDGVDKILGETELEGVNYLKFNNKLEEVRGRRGNVSDKFITEYIDSNGKIRLVGIKKDFYDLLEKLINAFKR